MNKFEELIQELVIRSVALKVGMNHQQAEAWTENTELIPGQLWPQIIAKIAMVTDFKNEKLWQENKKAEKERNESEADWISQFVRFKELNEVAVRELYQTSLKRADRTIAAEITTDFTARLAIIELENFSKIKRELKNYFGSPDTPPPESEVQNQPTVEERKKLVDEFLVRLRARQATNEKDLK